MVTRLRPAVLLASMSRSARRMTASGFSPAAIVAIHRTGGPADTFDAMTSTRAYRKALPVSGGNPFPP
jgi:hypothetical protein